MRYSCIVAMDAQRGIGADGKIPWQLPGDFKYFHEVTTGKHDDGTRNVAIMGRKTWDSLSEEHKPLPARTNIVISRNADLDLPEGAMRASSLDDALTQAAGLENAGEVFVIGGGEIFRDAIHRSECARLYITEIQNEFDCDTHFPEIPEDFVERRIIGERMEHDIAYCFLIYERNGHAKS